MTRFIQAVSGPIVAWPRRVIAVLLRRIGRRIDRRVAAAIAKRARQLDHANA